MFDIAEHRGCDITDFENNSRTVISNYFITYITWFNNYHSVHHKDSKDKLVTFYKRKKYFDLFDKYKTRKIEKSYLKFILKINENPSFYK
ncbi:hypothetical protein A9Q91_02130 [Candidatus Gracilibacteria bacterium 28_42_T64]|nr:hypothetical protein A9Q91_02130 [Candidatus Gracilibacteria bacterium 28_42_T64]